MSGQKDFVRFTKDEFEQFLDSLNHKFEEIKHPSGEYVYEHSGIIPDHPDVCIRIFSTVDKSTNVSRDKGSDAIRTTVWDKKSEMNIGGRTKTLRIKTWKENLEPKIVDIINDTKSRVTECKDEDCKTGWLIEREGKYGSFLGCTRYPSCNYTEKI